MKIYLVSKLEWNEDWCDTEVVHDLAFRDRLDAQRYIKEQGNSEDYTISIVELR